MSLDQLFEEGLLKLIPPSPERVRKSLQVSQKYLEEARKSLDAGANDLSVIGAYSSIFHAARAILFNDGVAEKSHFAIHDYLLERHPNLGKESINSFDLHRKLRHSVAYGLDSEIGEEDAQEAINFAQDFLQKTKKYLKM